MEFYATPGQMKPHTKVINSDAIGKFHVGDQIANRDKLDVATIADENQQQKDVEEIRLLLQSRRAWRERSHRIRTPVRRTLLQLRRNHQWQNQKQAEESPRRAAIVSALQKRAREDEVEKLSESLSYALFTGADHDMHLHDGPLEQELLRMHTTTPATPFFRSRVTTSKTQASSHLSSSGKSVTPTLTKLPHLPMIHKSVSMLAAPLTDLVDKVVFKDNWKFYIRLYFYQ